MVFNLMDVNSVLQRYFQNGRQCRLQAVSLLAWRRTGATESSLVDWLQFAALSRASSQALIHA